MKPLHAMLPLFVVLDRQRALALTDAQRRAIVGGAQTAQTRLVELDARLRADTEALASLLSAARVDEGAVETAARRVMRSENEVKAMHLAMLVRIRNQLTPTQRQQLDTLRL